MGKLQEFEITFDKNKVVYSPGDSISGTVKFRLGQPLQCKGETQLAYSDNISAPGDKTSPSLNKEVKLLTEIT